MLPLRFWTLTLVSLLLVAAFIPSTTSEKVELEREKRSYYDGYYGRDRHHDDSYRHHRRRHNRRRHYHRDRYYY
ncbi:hypothetical protein RvY_06653 [Ramazzottius varieornatus]|uniref:Uncharacterized protein n=1 Tax=Ramazzottius varieornatus TaxID=947166 RepID=A0A1D1V5K1_RAMVA|nr:hypothetical protein RvY_06653 [Ramazzottius varieornatus]